MRSSRMERHHVVGSIEIHNKKQKKRMGEKKQSQ